MGTDTQNERSARRPTLAGRVLIGVNFVLIAVLSLFLLWDTRLEWNIHIREKRTALDEEAKTLLPSVLRLRDRGDKIVQEFIDEVCGAMQEGASPGHHIAVRIGNDTLQARAHHRASSLLLTAMEQAVSSGAGLAPVAKEYIVVGAAAQGDIVIYVSEYLSNIKRILRSQIVRRMTSILVLGLALGMLLYVVLGRLLIRPLGGMVSAVQEFGQGKLGARMPGLNTRELGILADEFNRMADALETADTERHCRMQKARELQENLFPDFQGDFGVRFTCFFQPAADVSGDYYDILPLRDGTLLLCVADVTGHDVPAAMGAAMLKALLQTAVERESDPARLLEILNAALCRVMLAGDFATMILVRLDQSRRSLTVASAGHEPAYLIPPEGTTHVLTTTGLPLGVAGTARWTTTDLTMASGDRLAMVTDGLAETISASGEFFGRERLLAVLEENRSEPLDVLRERIIARITVHRGAGAPGDDMTMLLAEL